MKLPFDIHDGKKKRKCEYADLYIMVKFNLTYQVFSTAGIMTLGIKKKKSPGIIPVIYASLAAAKEINKTHQYNPMAYVGLVTLLQMENIGLVKCATLHKIKHTPLMQMVLDMNDVL